MKLLDKIKEIWNRLGQADVEVTSANAEEILKAEGNPELIVKETNKKTVVQKVATKPVKIGDILPTHNLEKEGRQFYLIQKMQGQKQGLPLQYL